MGIPEKIKIGGLEFSIKHDAVAADRDRYGEVSFMKQEITIDPTLPVSKQEETLMHEIIEVVNSCYSLDLSHKNITVIAFTLYQVLKDNDLSF